MAQWTNYEWCYTINAEKNSDEESAIAQLEDIYANAMGIDDVVYHICKGEVGESGNYHLQGFIFFNNKMTMKKVKKLFGCDDMHLEKRLDKSTAHKAAAYCRKEETAWDAFPLFEIGELPVEPCRTKDEAIARSQAVFGEAYSLHDTHNDPTEFPECPFCDLYLSNL